MMITKTRTLRCGRGHEDQRDQYPVGTRVRTITPITPDIAVGTVGKVTSHCHDGRIWVSFDGGEHGDHTFHSPSDFLVIEATPTTDTPTTTREEWRVVNGYGGWRVETNDPEIGPIGTYGSRRLPESVARQLITNHRQAGLVAGLVEALERYVNAYAGNKAGMLGNGQARRSLDEFSQLLTQAKGNTRQ